MRYYRAADTPLHEAFPGVRARVVHGGAMTLARWDLPAGTKLPPHEHLHEQILHVVSGALQVTVAGRSRRVGPGDTVVIPPRVPHAIEALERTQALDVFHPVRSDYR
jgi:quercetin dioxygenase-like cupin family protein